MKVVILCGGLGTRLREETEHRPKPMVEIGGRPILWHIMKLYAAHGFADFVLCLGFRGNMIKEYFLNYAAMNGDFTIRLGPQPEIQYHSDQSEKDFQVTLVDTGLRTMTGGRVTRIRRFVEGETFMVTYGDGLADVNLQAVLEFHRRHGKLATVTTVWAQSRFGVLEVDRAAKVNMFTEKPQVDQWINAGFFVFEPGVFDCFEGGDECVLESRVLEHLAADGQLMAFCHEGFFFAMDTYREYEALNAMWDSGQPPWRIWP